MNSFGTIMFTDAVRAEQDLNGSAEIYARIAGRPAPEGLGPDETLFIESRTSFYLASVGATGWPYVQHRGGPAGFLKVLSPTQIAFADYRGNRQYVTTGNLAGDDRVSLLLMDYPRRARLKILGHGHAVRTVDDPGLTARLATDGGGTVERLFVIDIAAIDWNCPKFITPRYSEDEIAALLGDRVAAVYAENETLKARLAKYEEVT